jgi:Uma2 family endonuclease
MADPAIPLFQSLDDFIAWEEKQELRYEFLPGGVLVMMSGGTEDRRLITTNILAALSPRIRQRSCYAFANAAKVVARSSNAVVYPDVVVRCGAPGGKATTVEDPVVVFEVLSETTARHDLTRKRQVYKGIPSIKIIVYVSQDEYRLDIVRRGADDRFDDEVLEGPDAVLALPEIGASLTLADIYADTSLATPPGDGG